MNASATELSPIELVRAALAEDLGTGDVTSSYFVDAKSRSRARLIAKTDCIISGTDCARAVLDTLLPSGGYRWDGQSRDGDRFRAGDEMLTFEAPTAALLSAERTILNFLQHLSGIATLTDSYVRAVAGTGATILDTRKTIPGWRRLAKAAVRHGGGKNHRLGLYDRVMVKDNHLLALRQDETPQATVARIRQERPKLEIEFEADTLEQVALFAPLGIDYILLDNMSLDQLREAVRIVAGRAQTEASGGVNLTTVRAIAETGVDFISVGALTHSAPAADISLEIVTTR